MSYLQWLDHSEGARRQAMDVIDLFQEQDTRDELGIGAVRDALADLFFPGTSTIQTRARYFLFIPWIYLDLESRKTPSAEMSRRASVAEKRLINVLAHSDDTQGVIGIAAREKLRRLPSNIYWQGLAAWGIRTFPGSLDQYHREADLFYATSRTGSGPEGDESVAAVKRNWHSGLPAPPAGFPTEASLRLLRREAEYLRERVAMAHPRTLLAFLLDEESGAADVAFPWEHPNFSAFRPHHQNQLAHARHFSEVMLGAALLYNLMLSEAAKQDAWASDYRGRMTSWAQTISGHYGALHQWRREEFWDLVVATRGAPVSPATRRFIDSWIDLTLTASELADSPQARVMIAERERTLKRSQARLSNKRALERWKGAAGSAQLNFRWPIAWQMIADIRHGLDRGSTNA